jgi:DNA replication and repair protein RecF
MLIEKLAIRRFKRICELENHFGEGVHVIIGDNAQGKTSFLESIHCLSLPRSSRLYSPRQVVRRDDVSSPAREETRVEATFLDDDQARFHSTTRWKLDKLQRFRRSVTTDDAERFQRVRIVMMRSQDIHLFDGGPQYRRDFIDDFVSQESREYAVVLNQYCKTLRARNRCLLQARKTDDHKELEAMTPGFVESGAKVIHYRLRYLKKLWGSTQALAQDFIPSLRQLELFYHTSGLNEEIRIGEDADLDCITRRLSDALSKQRRLEIASGVTICGPHRDDLIAQFNGFNIRHYGSAGQKRMLMLLMKMSVMNYFVSAHRTSPIVLLDDPTLDLDLAHLTAALRHLLNVGQAFVTLTDLNETILSAIGSNFKLFYIENGLIYEHKAQAMNVKQFYSCI